MCTIVEEMAEVAEQICETEESPMPIPQPPVQRTGVPLLFVDVNLAEGVAERITVYEGDKSSDLAR